MALLFQPGQQGKGVQPHHIPLIPQRPGAQGIKAAEESNGEVLPVKEPVQEDAEKQAGEAQLDGHQQAEIIQHLALRHQDAQQIQRASQIVGDQAQIVHAHAHIPTVKQAVPAEQRPAEGHKERIILMVIIRIQHGRGAEGVIAVDQHQQQHTAAGDQERKQMIPPVPPKARFSC